MFLECNPIETPGAAMVKREVALRAGLFDEERPLSAAADYDFFLRAARLTRVVRHTECILDYRQHETSMSKDKLKMLFEITCALDKLEAGGTLTAIECKKVEHGRRRWAHSLRPKQTLGYKLAIVLQLLRYVERPTWFLF